MGIIEATYASIIGNNVSLYGQATYSSGIQVDFGSRDNATVLKATNTLLVNGVSSTSNGDVGVYLNPAQLSGATIDITGKGYSTLTGLYLDTTSGDLTLAATSDVKLTLDKLTTGCSGSCGTLSVSGAGALSIVPYTSGTSIGLAGGTGTLALAASLFSGGSRAFTDGFSSITIGDSTSGAVTVGGALTLTDSAAIVSGGTITINSGASITDSQSSGTLVLATSGNFTNNSTAAALSANRWQVYSNSPATDNFGSSGGSTNSTPLLSASKAVWGTSYGGTVSSSGNRYVFAVNDVITGTVSSTSKTYGDSVASSLTGNASYSVSSAYKASTYGSPYLDPASSDFIGSLVIGSTGAAASASAGSYSITSISGSATSGYTVNYTPGTLTVNKAHLTVTASDASKTYGDDNPTFSGTISGYVNSETLASSGISGSASLTSTATSSTGAGSATITAAQGTLSATNYDFTSFVDGTLTIATKALTWAVASATGTYGTLASTGTATLSGVLSGDSVSGGVGLTTSSGSSVTLAASLAAGSYTESVTSLSGTSASNYSLASSGNTTGTLTISAAQVSLSSSVLTPFSPAPTTSSPSQSPVGGTTPAETPPPSAPAPAAGEAPAALSPRPATPEAPSAPSTPTTPAGLPPGPGLTNTAASVANTLAVAGTPPAATAALAGALVSGMTSEIANGTPPATAQANLQQNVAHAVEQNNDASIPAQPGTNVALGLAQGGGQLAQTIAQALGDAVALPENHAVAMAAIQSAQASGESLATALGRATEAVSAAAEQRSASTVAQSPDQRSVATLANGGASVQEALSSLSQGMSAAQGSAFAEAFNAQLAQGVSPAQALDAARSGAEAAGQALRNSSVPLTADQQAVAGLSGDGASVQQAVASLTQGMAAEQGSAFAEALASQMAQGVSPGQALDAARSSAEAAGQTLRDSSVPVGPGDALIASINQGMSAEGVLSAMGLKVSPNSPVGQAALRAFSEGLAKGVSPAAALAAAQDAAGAADSQVRNGAVTTRETDVQLLAAGEGGAGALQALVGKMDPNAPETAVFLDAVNRGLAQGLSGVEARTAAEAATRAASEQLAASQVPADGRSRLIQALAVGRDVVAAAEETVPELAAGHGYTNTLYRALLQPLSEGAGLGSGIAAVDGQAPAVIRHIELAHNGVPAPDPQLLAMASGTMPAAPVPGETPTRLAANAIP